MDALDLLILLVALAAAVGGYRLGFLGRAISWVGLAAGLYVAVRLLPTVVLHLHNAAPGTLLALAVIILVGGAMIGQGIGLVAGSRLHHALPIGPARSADRLIGAGLGAVGILALVWMLIPTVAAVPGWPARSVTDSAISRWLSKELPTPPDALQVLRRLIGNDAPQVFSALQPEGSSGPPPSASPLGAAITGTVSASTVKVEGQACDRIYEGSGFAVAPNVIVTNAHVVAGEPAGATSVLLPDGRRLPATVVMFDPNIDIAVLDVPSLGENPLSVGSPTVGAQGAVFGHPNGQDALAVSPARVAQEEEAVGDNLYDTHTIKRQILVLAAALEHGDSGGALVDASGQVIGVAFAISANQSGVAYALSSSELQDALSETRTASGVSTGSCLTD